MSRNVEMTFAVKAFGALAQETRLAVFRRLLACFPDPIPSGELAAACNALANTMSSHLGILNRAGLVASERQGRSILYRADLEGFRHLMVFLVGDCCDGRPEIRSPVLAPLLAA